ncbi:MAG: hypothetical protein J6T99_06215 [Oscillospiraceae bacterium]|nr:hypothetical protein [Oscillospiraceae bacterium]
MMLTLLLLLILLIWLALYILSDACVFLWRLGCLKVVVVILVILFLVAVCTGCSRVTVPSQMEAWIRQPDGTVLHIPYVDGWECSTSGIITIKDYGGNSYRTHSVNVLLRKGPVSD